MYASKNVDPEALTPISAMHNPAHHPELFIPPVDASSGPWKRRTLAEIQYSDQIVPWDVNGSSPLDLVAGSVWLENQGDGTLNVHRFADPDFYAARVCVADISGSGRPDIVLAEGKVHGGPVAEGKVYGGQGGVPVARLAWVEQSEPPDGLWPMYDIDNIRAHHSLGVADLDGDGQPEMVCAAHGIPRPYRSRLFLYKKCAGSWRSWYRTTLDSRFEHHLDGCERYHQPRLEGQPLHESVDLPQ